MTGQSPAAWLMARYRSRARGAHSNPYGNHLIDWRYDLCDLCEGAQRQGSVHWHGDYYMCLFGSDYWGVPETIRPSSKYTHP